MLGRCNGNAQDMFRKVLERLMYTFGKVMRRMLGHVWKFLRACLGAGSGLGCMFGSLLGKCCKVFGGKKTG